MSVFSSSSVKTLHCIFFYSFYYFHSPLDYKTIILLVANQSSPSMIKNNSGTRQHVPAGSPLCFCYNDHHLLLSLCKLFYIVQPDSLSSCYFWVFADFFSGFNILFWCFQLAKKLIGVNCDLSQRQQVIMTEQLAAQHKEIHFSSMHPGWADTPGGQRVYISYIQ